MQVTQASKREYYDLYAPKYLSWDFYSQYIDLEPNFGELGLFTFLRTYSRYIPEMERHEKWCEVCLRCADYSLWLEDQHDSELRTFIEKKQEAEDLFKIFFYLKGLPAGRTLWIGGTPLSKQETSANINCFKGTTLFLTKEYGYVQLQDHVNEQVQVLTALGWKPATVFKTEDSQHLWRTVFKNVKTNAVLTIYSSDNHRWLVGRGKRSVFTKQLSVGTRVLEIDLATYGHFPKWEVVTNEPTQDIEPVYCVSEPYTESFTIEGNILTKNCSSRGIDNISSFGEGFAWLLYGSGFGFSVEKKYLDCLPPLAKDYESRIVRHWYDPEVRKAEDFKHLENTVVFYDTEITKEDCTLSDAEWEQSYFSNVSEILHITVGDSKYGWISAARLLIHSFFIPNIKEIVVDYSYIRPIGMPLKTFGGTASGYVPYKELIERIVYSIKYGSVKPNNRMDSITCLNILNALGLCVVVGSVRRSSEICIFDKDDQDILNAKVHLYSGIDELPLLIGAHYADKEVYFPMAFSSLEKDWVKQLIDIETDKVTLEEVLSKYGWMLENSSDLTTVKDVYVALYKKYATTITLLGNLRTNFSSQSVQHCLDIAVENGVVPLELIYMRPCRTMSNNSVALYEKPSLGYIKDLLHKNKINGEPGLWNQVAVLPRAGRYAVPNPCFAAGTEVLTKEGVFSIEELLGKTVEIHDGDDWVEVSNFRVTGKNIPVYTVTLENKVEITATWYHKFILADGTVRTLEQLKVGDELKTNLKVLDYGDLDIDPYSSYEIVSIAYSHRADKVYCCTVHTNNSFTLANYVLVGQCAEILNSPQGGVCNLTETIVSNHVKNNAIDFYELCSTVSLLTRHSTRITLLPLWHPQWEEIQGKERLLGNSLSGIMSAMYAIGYQFSDCKNLWTAMRKLSRTIADDYHKQLGISKSLMATTIKPSGSLSLLAGVSSGIHGIQYPIMRRRIRVSKNLPIAKVLIKLGVPWEIENDQGTDIDSPLCRTLVFSFPYKRPCYDGYNESAIDQLNRYKESMMYWSEHNTSCTVSVGEDEWDDVAQWILDNFEYFVGVAFLPKFDAANSPYPLLPETPMTEKEYELLKASMPVMTEDEFIAELALEAKLSVEEDDLADMGCATGVCPVR
jgi:hypothetical protein